MPIRAILLTTLFTLACSSASSQTTEDTTETSPTPADPCWNAHENPPGVGLEVPHRIRGPFLGAPSPVPDGLPEPGPTPTVVVVEQAGDDRVPHGLSLCVDRIDFSNERVVLVWFLSRSASVASVVEEDAAIKIVLDVSSHCGGVAPYVMGPVAIVIPSSSKPVEVVVESDRCSFPKGSLQCFRCFGCSLADVGDRTTVGW